MKEQKVTKVQLGNSVRTEDRQAFLETLAAIQRCTGVFVFDEDGYLTTIQPDEEDGGTV